MKPWSFQDFELNVSTRYSIFANYSTVDQVVKPVPDFIFSAEHVKLIANLFVAHVRNMIGYHDEKR